MRAFAVFLACFVAAAIAQQYPSSSSTGSFGPTAVPAALAVYKYNSACTDGAQYACSCICSGTTYTTSTTSLCTTSYCTTTWGTCSSGYTPAASYSYFLFGKGSNGACITPLKNGDSSTASVSAKINCQTSSIYSAWDMSYWAYRADCGGTAGFSPDYHYYGSAKTCYVIQYGNGVSFNIDCSDAAGVRAGVFATLVAFVLATVSTRLF
jgi:hypothetical protein